MRSWNGLPKGKLLLWRVVPVAKLLLNRGGREKTLVLMAAGEGNRTLNA
jgi:hypothetical protein